MRSNGVSKETAVDEVKRSTHERLTRARFAPRSLSLCVALLSARTRERLRRAHARASADAARRDKRPADEDDRRGGVNLSTGRGRAGEGEQRTGRRAIQAGSQASPALRGRAPGARARARIA